MNNFSQQSLWSILRDAAGFKGAAHCWVWTNLARYALSHAGYEASPYGARINPGDIHTDIQNFIKARVPEGNFFKVRGRDIRWAIEQYNKRSDILKKLNMTEIKDDAEFFGFVNGRIGEEAILDGTADQMFNVGYIPQDYREGFYGTEAFLPDELKEVYRNSLPWELNRENGERLTI